MINSNVWGVTAFNTLPFAYFSADNGDWTASVRNPNTGEYGRNVIGPGRKIVPDFLTGQGGPLAWAQSKPIKGYLVPFGVAWSPPPSGDGLDWKIGCELKILIDESVGMTVLTSNSSYFVNRLQLIYNRWRAAAEACLGQLPVYEIAASEPIWNADQGRNFFIPKLVQVGWFERDPAVWGPATVALPMAELAAANLSAAALPPVMPTPTPANDTSPPSAIAAPTASPLPTTSVPPAASPPPSANDPLARYRPLAPGSKPAF